MIFPSVKMDSVVQVDDLFRMDFAGTSTHAGEMVETISVRVDSGDWIEVYAPLNGKHNQFIDWMLDSEGEKTIDIKFSFGAEEKDLAKSVMVVSAETDKHFSNDEMLAALEPEIYSLLPLGRISFKYAHRAAQARILRELAEAGKLVTKAQIMDTEEVSYWSRYLVLKMIFEGNVTGLSDIHTQKREYYSQLMESAKRRAVISLDTTGDGQLDDVARTKPMRLVLR